MRTGTSTSTDGQASGRIQLLLLGGKPRHQLDESEYWCTAKSLTASAERFTSICRPVVPYSPARR